METNNENQTGNTGKKTNGNGNGKPNQAKTGKNPRSRRNPEVIAADLQVGNSNGNSKKLRKNFNETEKVKSVSAKAASAIEKNTEARSNKNSKKPVKHNIEVLDTNAPINNWKIIRDLIKAGNLVVLPITLIKELDKLKTIDRTRREAMKVLREIDRLQTESNPYLVIETETMFTRLRLDKNNPDHQIIATLNYVAYHASREGSKYYGYDSVKMITDDYTVKILAREVNQKIKITVEPYFNNRVKINEKDLDIPVYYVSKDDVISTNQGKDLQFFAKGNLKNVLDGSPIIGYSNPAFKKIGEFCAIRQDDKFVILDQKISVFGISRLDLKIDHAWQTNWGQIIALHYLMNPKINCVFLHGATGSGKTLLAMAAGMELKRQGAYPKIVVYRIPESAYGDSSPALPGDVGQKIAPWTEPILQALQRLLKINKMDTEDRQENNPLDNNGNAIPLSRTQQKRKDREVKGKGTNSGNGNGNGNSNGNSKTQPPQTQSALKIFVDSLFEQNKVEIKVLDYVRGITIDDAFIIIDDSQNLNKKNIKDVITRAGKNAKIVFTGDLNQIDNKYIDKESSGLAHAIIKLRELDFVGVVSLPVTVRSPLAAAADKLL